MFARLPLRIIAVFLGTVPIIGHYGLLGCIISSRIFTYSPFMTIHPLLVT